MAWLLREGEVLASVDVARAPYQRVLQMSRRDSDSDAAACLLVPNFGVIHSLFSSGYLDIAQLDEAFVVTKVRSLRPNRVAIARWSKGSALLASSGAFERWRIAVGDHLVVKQ